MKFNKDNIITVYGFRDIYDGTYDAINAPDVIPPGQIIFCEISYIREFFELLKKYPERKIILISGESDYGVVYQKEFFSNQDVYKAYYRIDWSKFEQETEYAQIQLAACDPKRCNSKDKFAVKMDGFTACTFNEIPSNVLSWFTTNSNIHENNVFLLPFGVFDANDTLIERINTPCIKINKIYVNFDVNTYDRYLLKQFYRTHEFDFVYYREKAIPYPEFLEEFARHKYILSPKGNSMGDGYRHWESLYLKCMPILESSPWLQSFMRLGYPVIGMEDIRAVSPATMSELNKCYQPFLDILEEKSHLLDKKWWIDVIWSHRK